MFLIYCFKKKCFLFIIKKCFLFAIEKEIENTFFVSQWAARQTLSASNGFCNFIRAAQNYYRQIYEIF